jgi:hypothetical protein
MKNWIVKHKNAGMKIINDVGTMEIGKDLFKVWDPDFKKYIKFSFLNEKLISLGLTEDTCLAKKLLMCMKKREETYTMTDDCIHEMDWLSIFKKNRFGDKACQIIKHEYTEK